MLRLALRSQDGHTRSSSLRAESHTTECQTGPLSSAQCRPHGVLSLRTAAVTKHAVARDPRVAAPLRPRRPPGDRQPYTRVCVWGRLVEQSEEPDHFNVASGTRSPRPEYCADRGPKSPRHNQRLVGTTVSELSPPRPFYASSKRLVDRSSRKRATGGRARRPMSSRRGRIGQGPRDRAL